MTTTTSQDPILYDVERAGIAATKNGSAWYRRPEGHEMAAKYPYFLENHDAERRNFKQQLFNAGFKTEWYKAPYYWRMRKTYADGRTAQVTYVEGDVALDIAIPSTE